MSAPKVSVVLSSYNHADYIGESIESILSQTFADFELYIIDDCSTDNSWEIIKKYQDSRIIAIRNKKNIGIVMRPEIVDKLKGKYIAMAHCDDRWEPTKLEKQVKFLDEHREYAACFTQVKLIDDNGEEFKDRNHHQHKIFKQQNRSRLEWLQQFFYHGNALCHPSILLRTKVQKELKLYTTGLAALPDQYRWIKICLRDNIYIYQEELTCFRIRDDGENTSGDRLENQIRLRFEQNILLDLFLETLTYSKRDFLTIYPTAKKYLINKKNDMEYVFARTLIDMSHWRPYQFYGLKLLWHIMQNPNRRKLLEAEYNFTNRDFIKLSGSLDVFNFLADSKAMTATLYYDTGNGFNAQEFITKRVYINNQNQFRAEFELSKIKNIKQLRFDPCEQSYMCFKNIKITLDGEEAKYQANSHELSDDGYIKFNTNDPQFILPEGTIGKMFKITGIAQKRDYAEIDDLIVGNNIKKRCHSVISKIFAALKPTKFT